MLDDLWLILATIGMIFWRAFGNPPGFLVLCGCVLGALALNQYHKENH